MGANLKIVFMFLCTLVRFRNKLVAKLFSLSKLNAGQNVLSKSTDSINRPTHWSKIVSNTLGTSWIQAKNKYNCLSYSFSFLKQSMRWCWDWRKKCPANSTRSLRISVYVSDSTKKGHFRKSVTDVVDTWKWSKRSSEF